MSDDYDLATLKIEVDATDLKTATAALKTFSDEATKTSDVVVKKQRESKTATEIIFATERQLRSAHLEDLKRTKKLESDADKIATAAQKSEARERKSILDDEISAIEQFAKQKQSIQINSGLMTNRAAEQAGAANLAIAKKHRDFELADLRKTEAEKAAISDRYSAIESARRKQAISGLITSSGTGQITKKPHYFTLL